MKKLIITLLILSIFLTGCEFPTKYVCVEHNEIVMERVGQRDWRIPEGTIKIKIGGCENGTENMVGSLEAQMD